VTSPPRMRLSGGFNSRHLHEFPVVKVLVGALFWRAPLASGRAEDADGRGLCRYGRVISGLLRALTASLKGPQSGTFASPRPTVPGHARWRNAGSCTLKSPHCGPPNVDMYPTNVLLGSEGISRHVGEVGDDKAGERAR
jgi:hypothetical protein